MSEDAQGVLERINNRKEFANEYREERKEVEFDDLSEFSLERRTHDFTYSTGVGSKTIRSHGAMSAASYNDIPDGFLSFYYDGTKYAYNPEERRLISVNSGQARSIADENDIIKIEEVSYPTRAVVEGAIDDGVQATVYYRSPRSDEMQTVTMNVEFMEGKRSADQITGDEVNGDRRIEANTRWEREIVSKSGTTERTLGKVTRVEFPRGHQYTVNVEGVGERKGGESGAETIEKALHKKFGDACDDIEVTHEGSLEWD